MANEKNLVPMNKRTKSEQREIGKKGGEASGEARRAKKTMKEYYELVLGLQVHDRRKFNRLAKMGIPPEGIDNKMLMAVGIMEAAQSGDVNAEKEILKIIGEDIMPVNSAEAEEKSQGDIMKAVRKAIKNEDN